MFSSFYLPAVIMVLFSLFYHVGGVFADVAVKTPEESRFSCDFSIQFSTPFADVSPEEIAMDQSIGLLSDGTYRNKTESFVAIDRLTGQCRLLNKSVVSCEIKDKKTGAAARSVMAQTRSKETRLQYQIPHSRHGNDGKLTYYVSCEEVGLE